MIRLPLLAASLAFASIAGPAAAGEIIGGVYAHAVDTPFTFDTGERGVDVQIGVRSAPIERLGFLGKPQAHVFGSLNSEEGGTDFVAAGLSWKIGAGPVYVRPGIGLALHNAPDLRIDPATRLRTDLGSRVLFEPEIAVGTQVSERISVEASWIHISNARLFNRDQNPGIDMMGVRLGVRF
ncbi:acyloxyacyl hydrolase [Qipengyuania sp. MTN3-11]|uniref:acyloxyacyl hydrolase n=1 Tax=Qipengyuania sp. MTN3-11 TaxID=3056557 RepID=UPI0036F405E0